MSSKDTTTTLDMLKFSIPDPRETAKLVCSLSKHVTVDSTGISNLANWLHIQFSTGKYSIINWKEHELNPKECNENSIQWIFIVDSLNFSFWSEKER